VQRSAFDRAKRHAGATPKRHAGATPKRHAGATPLALPSPPDAVRRAEESATGYALRSFLCATHSHPTEDNHPGNPYTYPQPVLLQTGFHPGSEFNRPGGSKFTRRGQSLQNQAKNRILENIRNCVSGLLRVASLSRSPPARLRRSVTALPALIAGARPRTDRVDVKHVSSGSDNRQCQ